MSQKANFRVSLQTSVIFVFIEAGLSSLSQTLTSLCILGLLLLLALSTTRGHEDLSVKLGGEKLSEEITVKKDEEEIEVVAEEDEEGSEV